MTIVRGTLPGFFSSSADVAVSWGQKLSLGASRVTAIRAFQLDSYNFPSVTLLGAQEHDSPVLLHVSLGTEEEM